MLNNKFLLFFLLFFAFASCEKQDDSNPNSGSGSGSGNGAGMGSGGGTGTGGGTGSSSFEFETFHTHDKNILKFDCDGTDGIAIYDGTGISLDYFDNQGYRFYDKVNYQLDGTTYQTDLTSITDLEFLHNELYVGTADGHLVIINDDGVRGAPIRIKKLDKSKGNMWAIWGLNENYFQNGFDGFMLSEIEIEDDNIYYDNGNCLDFSNLGNNLCSNYNLSDFAIPYFIQFPTLLDGQNKIIVGEDHVEHLVNLSKHPFSLIKEIEWVSLVQTPAGSSDPYVNLLWCLTDNGFGIYPSDYNNTEAALWKDEDWIYVNTDFGLLSNTVDDMVLLNSSSGDFDKRLVAYSNTPKPVFYYINGENGTVCYYSNENGLPSSNGLITDIDQDHSYNSSIYIAQGKKIIEIETSYLRTGCGF